MMSVILSYIHAADLIWGRDRTNLGALPASVTSQIFDINNIYTGSALMHMSVQGYSFKYDDLLITVDANNIVSGSANIQNSGINETLNIGSIIYAISESGVQDPQKVFFKNNLDIWIELSLNTSTPYFSFDNTTRNWNSVAHNNNFPGIDAVVGKVVTDQPILYNFPDMCSTCTHIDILGNFTDDSLLFGDFFDAPNKQAVLSQCQFNGTNCVTRYNNPALFDFEYNQIAMCGLVGGTTCVSPPSSSPPSPPPPSPSPSPPSPSPSPPSPFPPNNAPNPPPPLHPNNAPPLPNMIRQEINIPANTLTSISLYVNTTFDLQAVSGVVWTQNDYFNSINTNTFYQTSSSAWQGDRILKPGEGYWVSIANGFRINITGSPYRTSGFSIPANQLTSLGMVHQTSLDLDSISGTTWSQNDYFNSINKNTYYQISTSAWQGDRILQAGEGYWCSVSNGFSHSYI